MADNPNNVPGMLPLARACPDQDRQVMQNPQSGGRAEVSHLRPPDIFSDSITVSERGRELRESRDFSNHYVHRFVEQLIWISATLMSEIANQFFSNCLILSYSQLIIRRK